MKKVLSVLLVVMLMTSLLSGCKGTSEDSSSKGDSDQGSSEVTTVENNQEDSTKEDVERDALVFNVVLREGEVSPSEVLLYQDLEKETGVKIEWRTATTSGWNEKKSLIFAGGDLPDAFFGENIIENDEVLRYGSQGFFIPLEDYITPEIMPNFSKIIELHPEYRNAMTTPDGHIYGLPFFNDGLTPTTNMPLFINIDWLEAVGMEAPTNYDEFYEVLKAFKENDVNGNGDADDEIPFTFRGNISDLFSSFGVLDSYKTHIDVKDGKVYYTAITDEYKEAIKYFNKLASEGLIDEESFTHDGKTYNAKIKSEMPIVGSYRKWRVYDASTPIEERSYMAIEPLTGPTGLKAWPELISGIKGKGAFTITSSAKDPEYIMRWIDHVFEPEFALQAGLALKIGTHIEKLDNGKFGYIEGVTPDNDNRKYNVPFGFERITALTELSTDMLVSPPLHLVEKLYLDTFYNKYYKEEVYPEQVFFSLEELEELAILKADIITYTNEMYAKWIAVGGIEEEWDNYKKQLNSMKLDRLVEIYQNAHDRYYK